MSLCRLPIAAFALFAAGCSPAAPKQERAAGEVRTAAPREARPKPAPVKPAGCSARIAVVLDRPSLFGPAQAALPESRLAAFLEEAAAAFHRAADEACAGEPKVRKALAPVRRLLVQSASGAMDPTFFPDEEGKSDVLVFQWPFNEADLALPGRKDVEQGLRCWADPGRHECADIGD